MQTKFRPHAATKSFPVEISHLLENSSARKTDSCRTLTRFCQSCIFTTKGINSSANLWNFTGVLISPEPDILPNVFCLMVRTFRLMLVLLYI
jgi:hypothetical protein